MSRLKTLRVGMSDHAQGDGAASAAPLALTPEEFVEQVGPDEYRCAICHAAEFESEEFDSFGGTTEGYVRCLGCGATASWCDMSAVI